MTEPKLVQLLRFAIDQYPLETSVESMLQVILDAARANDKRPAYVKLAVHDDVVKNIKGKEKLTDIYLVVKIDRMVLDRFNSPILLDKEA